MKFDIEYLEKLAQIVRENDLSEITLEDEEKTVSFRRDKVQETIAIAPQVMGATATSHIISPAVETKQPEKKKETVHKGKPVTAPMVGTFYCSPSPDDAPFVNVGDNISIGQVVCIIEAMKLMNEIEADASGRITEICVKNGESVEFGQVLMYVE